MTPNMVGYFLKAFKITYHRLSPCNFTYKSYPPHWTSQIQHIFFFVISGCSFRLCCLDLSMWHHSCSSWLTIIITFKNVHVLVSRTWKLSHYTWQRGIQIAGVSESGRLSWIIWVVPVETRVFTKKEGKEQTIRGLRLQGRAAKAGFGNEGGRKTWSKKGEWPLETAKGKKSDSPLQFLGRNMALLTMRPLMEFWQTEL